MFCINRLPLDEVVSITILRQILDDEAIFHGIYAGERLDTDHYGSSMNTLNSMEIVCWKI